MSEANEENTTNLNKPDSMTPQTLGDPKNKNRIRPSPSRTQKQQTSVHRKNTEEHSKERLLEDETGEFRGKIGTWQRVRVRNESGQESWEAKSEDGVCKCLEIEFMASSSRVFQERRWDLDQEQP